MTTRRQLREARRRRSRKVRAVLAAGVVFGVGAAATLAAWNDSEHATGTFTASTFGIQGSTDGTTYTDHPNDSSAASLMLSSGFDGMSPNTDVYAFFSVRTITDSVSGTVQLTAASTNDDDLGGYLEYSVRTVTGNTCDESAFNAGSPAGGLPQGEPLTAGASGTQSLAANQASPVNYCFKISMPSGTSNDAQGLGITAKWTFIATSSS